MTDGTREPTEIVAGDSLAWTRTLADHPASAGWTLAYRLVGPKGAYDIAAAAAGDDFAVAVDASGTHDWAPGEYVLGGFATLGAARHQVVRQIVTVQPNLATAAGGHDPRSHVKRVLDAIEAVIEGRATKDQQSYAINGRQLGRTPIADLLRLRGDYKSEYAREQQAARLAAGLGGRRRILTRFRRSS